MFIKALPLKRSCPQQGRPQRVLSGVLHSFLASGQAGVPFQPVPVPALGLPEGDKQCIRDRSCIMARHILADQPEEYIQAQVNTLLHSLDIDSDYRMRSPMHGPYPELEEYWNQSQSALRSAPMHNAADKWITEFGKQNYNPEDWAHSFDQQYGPNGWASEFEQAKALAEKNERDMQVQREQAERDRISDTLDFEIKRWAAGKEGNLRALLSTLQYISFY